MLRALRIALIVLLVGALAQPAAAQLVLKPAAERANRYLLQFVPQPGFGATAEKSFSTELSRLRAAQERSLRRLQRDLSDTDLVVHRSLWLRQAVSLSISPRYLERLRELDYVQSLRPERFYRVEPQGLVQLPLSSVLAQDNLDQVDVDALWAEGYRGQSVVVAILDSGVDLLHQDLQGSYRGGSNSWYDPYGEQDQPIDLSGHGTAVASIVLGGSATGSAIGVAPAAQWMAARVFDNSGSSSESAISEVLQWLLDPDGDPDTADQPDIVQNSWGLAGTEGSCINPFATELAALATQGMDIVFAVGNSGSTGASSFLTPAFDPHVLSVGALQPDGAIWYNSSRGPDRCGSAVIPAFMAPGENIKAATLSFNGFDSDNSAIHNGTSFSSPHLSGVLALLRSRFQSSAEERISALRQTAEDKGPAGVDADFGYGLVKASAAAEWLNGQSIPQQPKQLFFSAARYRFGESAGTIRVQLLRKGSLKDPAAVEVSVRDVSTRKGEDYLWAGPVQIDFDSGEFRKDIEITLLDDNQAEQRETMELVLNNPVGASLGSPTSLRVEIEDDDGAAEEDQIGGAALTPQWLFALLLLAVGRRRWA